ncbi:HAMP domain-containing protein, partial [Streptomyces sp. NPDC056081]|uniref:HAMP domain-containing protein n=1 Tax=Streptomyces sp. NPDC056081 TaxID=3345705 RepID=UPI0035E03293
MRWALVKVCLAVTTMVVVAFAVPLGLVIREMASDRAFSDAERQAAAIGPTLSITADREQLTRAVRSTEAGAQGRVTVHVPGDGTRAALEIGRPRATDGEIAATRKLGRESIAKVSGGSALMTPFALRSGKTAIVEVFVPEDEVGSGVTAAWIMLAGVGVALVAGSIAVADRLGARMTQPAAQLASAAHELGEGRLDVRVPESGPAELEQAAVAFNSMADQLLQLLANERELAADLSHRLRTPLTVLRLNTASLGSDPAADQTRAAVDQLEHEVDMIIRTAREARPQATAVAAPRAGCDPARVIRARRAVWSARA